ncbi:S8 family serine peptidase [Streptomyces sp. NBC_00562]|uniref:S8 family serine peptidase n=1 Tax=Streptomyces sp. NBC_00562 TaxID=2975777 RepID=UPI002E820B7B|nr:S8 family serine peptidase [Streptomyces sp. NBC_00562]WUC22946.1 S8 family serine peptidase [Streptomyces sp. NBC_00562]
MPFIPARRRAALAIGVVLAVFTAQHAVSATAAPGTDAPDRSSASTATHQPTSRTVTLLTGDRVTVNTAADGRVTRSVQGADGQLTGATTHKVGKDTYVYPDAALPYIAAEKLDRELFNVTKLLADGYGDEQSSTLPLIVTYTDAAVRARTQAVPSGATRTLALTSIQGAALSQKRTRAADFWSSLTGGTTAVGGRSAGAKVQLRSGIAKVWLDGKVKADLADTTKQIGAPQVWESGDTGQGVDVAVLDTGVDTQHPDIVGQVAASTSFVPDQDVEDHNGHGTHVASTIAGTGAASDGKEKGVAPGARLHVGKVLGNDGSGQESWVLAGMEWAARDQHAKVISLSLGAGPSDGHDPMSEAVNQLSAETGALFTIASGNAGPHSVSTPSVADAALSVGAVDASDQLAEFSSTGPRQGDAGLKPELTAPGVDVLAARSQYVTDGEGYYQTLSGTSMATPHVAGAAALLAAAHPDWTGQQLKDGLVSTAKSTPKYTPYEGGSGRLDVAAAVKGTVFATASAFGGYRDATAPADDKTEKEVTYTNTADSPITLNLAVQAPGAATGAFSLSAQQVTVPAHGSSKVTLTTDFDLVKADTVTSGQILATDASGAPLAHTITGAYKMGSRHTLTINGKDREGRPMGGEVWVVGQKLAMPLILDDSGTGTVSLPPGAYYVSLESDVRGSHGPRSRGLAILAAPEVVLDKDATVTLDASKAKPVSVRTPQETTLAETRIDLYRGFDNGSSLTVRRWPNAMYDSFWALPSKPVTTGTYEFGGNWRLTEPALTVTSRARAFDDLRVQRGRTPLSEGTRQYKAVYAGDGGPAAYAGLDARGKVVVIRRSDAVEPAEQAEQAERAAKAGAKVLLVVNDGNGRLNPWSADLDNPWSDAGNPPPLTVATLTADEGDELITQLQQGRSTALTVTSHPTTDYLYDINHHWAGVPADPTYQPQRRDLARVDVSFRNNRPARGMEFRSSVWLDDYGYNMLPTPTQGERTDWVSTDTEWAEAAQVNQQLQISSDVLKRYPTGKTSHLQYFAPIQRPRLDGSHRPFRVDDKVYAQILGWGDSDARHVGMTNNNADVQNRVKLYQGDTLIRASVTDTLGSFRFPLVLAPEKLRYRLVSDNARGNWTNDYSTTTRTEWGFTSERAAAGTFDVLPLIQLDYAVEGMNIAGKTGRHAGITVTPSHLPGAPSSDTIKTVSVDVSYDDGATWQHAALTHTARGWSTQLNAPAKARFVTLRTSAGDTEGNGVTQSITRAFGLK